MSKIGKFFEEMSNLQRELLSYLRTEDDNNEEEDDNNLFELFNGLKKKPNYLFALLQLISQISNNGYKLQSFYNKIETILSSLKDSMDFSNEEIFNLFEQDKKIIEILFATKIISIDDNIADRIINSSDESYKLYFLSRLKKYYEEDDLNNLKRQFNSIQEDEEKRKVILDLIDKNSLKRFKKYYEDNNLEISPDEKISLSVYETDSLLIENQDNITVTEYAAFCGSINIFKFLYNKMENVDSKMWLYAIHGNNEKIIDMIEESEVNPPGESFLKCAIEAIKCHHNELALKFIKKYKKRKSYFLENCLEYYNFDLIDSEKIDDSMFFKLCQYNYSYIVKLLLNRKESEIDVNEIVFTFGFFNIVSKQPIFIKFLINF